MTNLNAMVMILERTAWASGLRKCKPTARMKIYKYELSKGEGERARDEWLQFQRAPVVRYTYNRNLELFLLYGKSSNKARSLPWSS